MAKCIPELWTLKEIHESLSKGFNGEKKIVIPMFQRGKRWTPKQQENFIESLKRSYPIGTLLFYKTMKNDTQIYTLIDGLQRGTAIKKYLSKPTHFFSIEQIPMEILLSIYDLSEADEDEYDDLNAIILNYVHNLSSFDSFEIAELFTEIAEEFVLIKNKLKEFTALVKPVFQKIKEEYTILSNSQIPAIVYSGEEETLPDIFTLMNSQGTPLTDYEIYAASWPSKKFKVANENIIDYVLKKYDCLNDDGYEVYGYDRDELRKNKELSAFEYVFGLSKFLSDTYSVLGFNKNLSPDAANPIAFQLINACFNSSHNQIKDVYNAVLEYSDVIDDLESCLIKAINFVDSAINQIVRFKGNTRNSDKILHSQFQILSLISFVFREMYDKDLQERDTWKAHSKILKENIWKYYVYDILVKYWSEGGTTKIHTSNTEKRYLTPLSKGMFSVAFDNYVESCNSIQEKSSVSNPNEKDIVILNTIYLSIFTALDQLSLSSFDIEHIATKKQMKNLIKKCKGLGLPISHIANICYLPEGINRTKQQLNFYQDATYLEKANCTIDDIEQKYSFTNMEMLEWMDIEYQPNDFPVLKEYYFDYIKERCKIIKEKFITALGFSFSEDDVAKEFETITVEGFTDDFFRLERIGIVVKTVIEYLLDNEMLTEDDFANVENVEYCLKYLGCAFPLFTKDKSKITDSNGKNRYWVEPLYYKDQPLYVCSQWFESDRKRFVPWAKAKLNQI